MVAINRILAAWCKVQGKWQTNCPFTMEVVAELCVCNCVLYMIAM